jgi:hypothetical protein
MICGVDRLVDLTKRPTGAPTEMLYHSRRELFISRHTPRPSPLPPFSVLRGMTLTTWNEAHFLIDGEISSVSEDAHTNRTGGENRTLMRPTGATTNISFSRDDVSTELARIALCLSRLDFIRHELDLRARSHRRESIY